MKWFSIFKKNCVQQRRDLLGFSLAVFTAPAFVLLYWLFFSNNIQTYNLIILNQEHVKARDNARSIELVRALEGYEKPSGEKYFSVKTAESPNDFHERLLSGRADAGIIIHPGFSPGGKKKNHENPAITIKGNATLPVYIMSSAIIRRAVNHYMEDVHGKRPLLNIVEKPLGLSNARTGFELYVPGLLVFAVIMIIFSSSVPMAREVETGTMVRLRMSMMNTLDLMIGMSLVQFILGVLSIGLTFLTARFLGFESAGSTGLALLISSAACFSSIGIGMMVVSLSGNMTQTILISSVAMFLLVLFSGVIFPVPESVLFSFYGFDIGPLDLLPTVHMRSGLDKVLNLGASWGEVKFEIIMLLVISILYFTAGLIFFNNFKIKER